MRAQLRQRLFWLLDDLEAWLYFRGVFCRPTMLRWQHRVCFLLGHGWTREDCCRSHNFCLWCGTYDGSRARCATPDAVDLIPQPRPAVAETVTPRTL